MWIIEIKNIIKRVPDVSKCFGFYNDNKNILFGIKGGKLAVVNVSSGNRNNFLNIPEGYRVGETTFINNFVVCALHKYDRGNITSRKISCIDTSAKKIAEFDIGNEGYSSNWEELPEIWTIGNNFFIVESPARNEYLNKYPSCYFLFSYK